MRVGCQRFRVVEEVAAEPGFHDRSRSVHSPHFKRAVIQPPHLDVAYPPEVEEHERREHREVPVTVRDVEDDFVALLDLIQERPEQLLLGCAIPAAIHQAKPQGCAFRVRRQSLAPLVEQLRGEAPLAHSIVDPEVVIDHLSGIFLKTEQEVAPDRLLRAEHQPTTRCLAGHPQPTEEGRAEEGGLFQMLGTVRIPEAIAGRLVAAARSSSIRPARANEADQDCGHPLTLCLDPLDQQLAAPPLHHHSHAGQFSGRLFQ